MHQDKNFPQTLYAPDSSEYKLEYKSLTEIRDNMTNSKVDDIIKKRIENILYKWKKNPKSVLPYSEFESILEDVRVIPVGNKRIEMMNSIVRTLGKPENLATYLDMLREASSRNKTNEKKICQDILQSDKMHSVYGWCGNTTIVESLDFKTKGTHKPIDGLEEKLGTSTTPWKLIIHIWQPNKNAKGFPLDNSINTKKILEPPHSHPFNFASMIVKGEIHQSIYSQVLDIKQCSKKDFLLGHYRNTELNHVDGVWPPHSYLEKCYLKTKEHRVKLNEGDSYYMPCNWIHDVEVDEELAKVKPTISLFLSSEFLVMPHVYMNNSMLEFHQKNPLIKKQGRPISEKKWHKKLSLISDYLRNKSESLDLNNVVKHEGEYAFQHKI